MTCAAVREQLPRFVAPMLLSYGRPEDGDRAWAVEVKWDGIRAQLRVQRDGDWCLRSRPGSDRSDRFGELADVAERLARDVILDGELVHLAADGKPDFDGVRRRLVGAPAATTPLTFIAFDLLHLDGWNLRPVDYGERRRLLGEVLQDGPGVKVPAFWVGEVDAVVAVTRDHHLEGVACKRLDSPYRSGRSTAWRKLKHRRRQRLTVSGWRPGEGEPHTIYFARVSEDGWSPAGTVQFVDAAARGKLCEALRDRERPGRRGRGGIRNVERGVDVVVEAHGRPDGPVRDAVLREVLDGPDA